MPKAAAVPIPYAKKSFSSYAPYNPKNWLNSIADSPPKTIPARAISFSTQS
ncbi:MAG: hypothetical protein MUP55_03415 [Candidatus Aenigmarchaeota archaeon]|nr:hypothetical protein [Candidatus Aenigmarchaeota archaeon]